MAAPGSFDGQEQRVALLPAVVHHDVDMRVVLLHPPGAARARSAGSGAAVRRSAGHDRGQLAATAEQPVEDLGGDPEQVRADHGEVALDDAEHVAGSHGPAIVMARRAAMVTAPCRACQAVAVISSTSCSKLRPGSWTPKRGEALHLGLGGLTTT